jgi:hypothetical protein
MKRHVKRGNDTDNYLKLSVSMTTEPLEKAPESKDYHNTK